MGRRAALRDMDERTLALFWVNLLDPNRAGQLCALPTRPSKQGVPAALLPRTILCWWCRDYHSPEEVITCMALPRKLAATEGNSSSTSSALTPGLLAGYSEIWDFLTASKYPDGAKRLTGRISLSCESGQLKLSCTDDATGQYVCLSYSSLDDALLAFESGLAAGDLPWRPSKFKGQGRR